MENLQKYENENYQNAKTFQINSIERFKQIIRRSFFVTQIIVYLNCEIICNVFKKIFSIFFSEKVKDISGEIALVTGSANGLGREIACKLAQNKCDIAVADLNIVAAQKTAIFIEETFKVRAKAFKVDVANYEEVEKLKFDIETSLGPVDILVNNAGIVTLMSLREGKPQDIQKIIDVNLTSHFWTVRVFLDGMIQRKRGHIVGISSIAGKIPIPTAIAYSTTKHGVKAFMDSLYEELCAFNHEKIVQITTVFPYFISTRKELDEILEEANKFIPVLTVEEVADRVLEGIKKNQRDVTIPRPLSAVSIVNFFPDKTARFAKFGAVSKDFPKRNAEKIREKLKINSSEES